jgi:transcriptional regulator with XRE-family HTH domain
MKKSTFPGREYKLKIGSNVRKWRNLKSIKQKELASSLNLSEAAVSNIENDITDISLRQLEDIAGAINISIEQLLNDPQESFNPVHGTQDENRNPGFLEKELLTAVITSLEKKDEQLQKIVDNVLRTMSSIVQEKKGKMSEPITYK